MQCSIVNKNPFYVNVWTSLIPPLNIQVPPPPSHPVFRVDRVSCHTALIQLGLLQVDMAPGDTVEESHQIWIYILKTSTDWRQKYIPYANFNIYIIIRNETRMDIIRFLMWCHSKHWFNQNECRLSTFVVYIYGDKNICLLLKLLSKSW